MNHRERCEAKRDESMPVVTTEVYELIGKGGVQLMLAVVPMRQWAEKNVALVQIPLLTSVIDNLFARGAVTEERLKTVIATKNPKPILLCRDINDGGDEIVDGNHTYVAIAMACAMAERTGLAPKGIQPGAPAYILEPEQWRGFVIPPSLVAKRNQP